MASCSEQHLLDDYVSQTSAQIHLVASSLLRKEQKYDRNGIKIDAKELERLQILSGHIDEPGEFIPDSVYVGPDYLEADTVATSE
jgi:hypothetical protein